MTHFLNILAETQNAIDKFFLPPSASNLSHDVDWAWNFVLGITTFFFIVVVGAMTFFVIRYRRRGPNEETSTITHNTPLEIMWTGIPLVLVLAIFYIGFKGFINYDTPQSNCRPINVTASSWKFDIEYPNGARDVNTVYLEKNVPVVFNIQSSDVLHAFYIPAFRTQRNAIAGRVTQIWCIPEELSPPPLGNDPGGWDFFCTQYCGEQHSKMGGRVHVLEKADYDKKMIELANPFKTPVDPVTKTSQWIPYVKVGEKLYQQNCAQCHSVDEKETVIIGPPWRGLWKSKAKFSETNVPGYTLDENDSDQKWEDYIKESILQPNLKIVAPFPNVMPPQSQFGGTDVNEEKLRAIIEYMKSIGNGVTKEHPYDPRLTPEKNPDLFKADEKHPVHPESLAAQKAATQATTQKAP